MFFRLVVAMPLCASAYMWLLCLCVRLLICAMCSPAGKGLTSRLPFVVSSEFFTFPLVAWVRWCI